MKCPVDQTTLQMSERQGIEIDYCPTCRGVWLDRGELDKIIEKSAGEHAPTHTQTQHRDEHPTRRDDQDYDDRRTYDAHYTHKRKRENFLSEIFDFG